MCAADPRTTGLTRNMYFMYFKHKICRKIFFSVALMNSLNRWDWEELRNFKSHVDVKAKPDPFFKALSIINFVMCEKNNKIGQFRRWWLEIFLAFDTFPLVFQIYGPRKKGTSYLDRERRWRRVLQIRPKRQKPRIKIRREGSECTCQRPLRDAISKKGQKLD